MKNWQILPAISPDFVKAHPDLDSVLLQLLANRGLKETADINAILKGTSFYDPFLFKNMAAAVNLIIKHLKAGHQIIVYGDYDADGVTSSVILLETLNILHGHTGVYLPDRSSEGYGLNRPALKKLADQGVRLIITVDNGIRNKAEVDYAKELGLDIIITDHHVLPEKETDLPDCIYIDPADPNDTYPWKYLAGVGVSFKLVSALLAKANLPEKQKKLISDRCLDLVAVGTVSDLVNILGENRQLVKEGLKILNQGKRLGINELLKEAKINNRRPLDSWNIGWQIGPRLNAASRLAHANTAFALLTATDPTEARRLAKELNERNLERQRITAEITSQADLQIDSTNLPDIIIAVCPSGQKWNEGVIGLVAGRLAEKYYRPTLVIARVSEDGEVRFKGSGRSVEEFNLIAAIEDCSSYLDKYGGHPMACGLSVVGEDNLEIFKKEISALTKKQLKGVELIPKLKIDAELELARLNLKFVEELNRLAPYGQNNPQPYFASFGLVIGDIMTMGVDNQHIKLRVFSADQSVSFWALAFGAADKYKDLKVGDKIDLAYSLDINDFNGHREVQLKIIDLKQSEV